MRFFLDDDGGALIRGWVVPDNPLAISRVAVSVDGRRVAEVPATITDRTFVDFGWHSTGQCTFVVTEAEVPQLASLPRLEIHDMDTNVLVHRRVPADGLSQTRLLLINTSIEPENVAQQLLFKHFQQSYFGIGTLSEELMLWMLGNQTMTSCFLSGSIIVPRYEGSFTPEQVVTATVIHDPHVEMATRLTWLRDRAGIAADPATRWRLRELADAAAFMADYDLASPKSLKRLFQMLPEAAYRLLYNPLTRQFGTKLPNDGLRPGNSIVAIEIIARVGVVGHANHPDAFLMTLMDRLGIDDATPPTPPPSAEILDLAERLRGVKAVADMLVFDLVLSEAVSASVAKAWTGP